MGAAVAVVGVFTGRPKSDPNLSGDPERISPTVFLMGLGIALVGANMKAILHKKARENHEKAVSFQNSSSSTTGGLKFNLDNFDIGYNRELSSGQVALSFSF